VKRTLAFASQEVSRLPIHSTWSIALRIPIRHSAHSHQTNASKHNSAYRILFAITPFPQSPFDDRRNMHRCREDLDFVSYLYLDIR